MDSEALTVISFLSETDKKQKVCVGQAQSAQKTNSLRRNFPQFIKLVTGKNSVDGTNSNGDRLYEFMQDHSVKKQLLSK